MKVVSISNIKGGVGKTTTAAVLSVGLAEKGYKILMVDSDPQTNLSMCFFQEKTDESPSLYHVYRDIKSIEEVKVPVNDKLDLIIGDFELCNADMQFTKAGRLKILKKAIRNIDGKYDFVIIDTPPNLGVLSLNAFLASDYVIVPMTVDSFSFKGVRLLKVSVVNDVVSLENLPNSILDLNIR